MNHSVLCFRKIPVAKKFMDKGGGGEFPVFLSKIICLTVPKFSVEGGSFTVAIISGNEKDSIRGGGEYQDFPSKNVCLTVPKNFVRETFSVSLFPRTEKVRIKEGGVTRLSIGTFLSHSTEKLHRGILLCFRKYLVSKKFKEEKGRE